jgi:hypothetical protein
MKLKYTPLFIFLLFAFTIVSAKSTQTMAFDKTETIYSDTTLQLELQKLKNSNDSIDQRSAYLLANNDIFKEDWVNDVTFPYKTKIDNIPDSVFIPLVSKDEKFTLTWFGQLNSTFKYRWGKHHNGLDINLKIGDTVLAAFDGIVRYAQFSPSGFGNCVIIRHLNGLETVYGHMSKLIVAPNDYVTSGQPIGLGGSTGHSTGPHLHMETRYKDIPFDPQLIIDVNTQKLKKDSFVLFKNYLTAYKTGSNTSVANKTTIQSPDSTANTNSEVITPVIAKPKVKHYSTRPVVKKTVVKTNSPKKYNSKTAAIKKKSNYTPTAKTATKKTTTKTSYTSKTKPSTSKKTYQKKTNQPINKKSATTKKAVSKTVTKPVSKTNKKSVPVKKKITPTKKKRP